MHNTNEMIKSNGVAFVITRVIAVLMLFWAYGRHPYGYYQIMRFVVCGAGIYGAYLAHKLKNDLWLWTFGIIAVLFNPVFPIHLRRTTWEPIDIITGIVLTISLFWKQSLQSRAE